MQSCLPTAMVMVMVLQALAGTLLAAETFPSASDFNITPNASDDQTERIQQLLDAVAARKGGRAELPAGSYVLRGSLRVPEGVSLVGSWEQPHHGMLDKGTVLLAYGGRGMEEGPALIELAASSGVKGLTICYPEQKISDVQPYPWTIHGQGMHNTVENVTLVNSYQGIAMGPQRNELHVVRNVFGCVLRRGLFIDNTTDIGRIENVHFNPHYWARSGHEGARTRDRQGTMTVANYMQQNLEAFIFARTDWESVKDTFVFGAKVGYHFIQSKSGACNGQFTAIAADACQYCVIVDAAQGPGILISNGQFVCLRLQEQAEPRIGVWAGPGFSATLQLSNCSFWGDFTSYAKIEGQGFFTMGPARLEGARGTGIELLGGRASLRDLMFKSKGQHVLVGDGIRRAVISDNFAEGGVRIENRAGDRLVVRDNEPR